MHALFDSSHDPLTQAWLDAIVVLAAITIALPLVRTLAGGLLWCAGTLLHRPQWRSTGKRVMPRMAHLIGSLVIGSAAIAAPVMAAPSDVQALSAVDLDRDAGAGAHASVTAQPSGTQQDTAAAQARPTKAAPSTRVAAPTPAPATRATGSRATATPPPARAHEASATQPASTATRSSSAASSIYIVRSGDTLWDIAASHLDEASDAEITEGWKAIWRDNREVIGDHPELIRPGQRLQIDGIA